LGRFNVYVLTGGWPDWYDAEYPYEELTEEEYSFDD
jgi:3-mercaptopyruvate sulfurtransferase SseA